MFRLNYLKLKNHHILGNIEMSFCPEENHSQVQLFSTIVIGQNGTGKSNVLKVISEIFRAFDMYKSDPTKKPDLRYSFRLRYSFNSDIYEIATSQLAIVNSRSQNITGFHYFKNNQIEILNNDIILDLSLVRDYGIEINELPLPKRVLASSLMITDKFNAKSNGIYKYLGVRNENSPSSTGTRTYVRKTVDNIIDGIKQKNFAQELSKLFIFLELDTSLKLSYIPRYRSVFYREDINAEYLNQVFIDNWQQYFPNRSSPVWGANYFSKIKDDVHFVEKIASFLKQIYTKVFVEGNRRSLDYDIINDDVIVEDYEMIQALRHLDILSYPELSISRFSRFYDFISSSSGETHMISEFIGILSQIQENSLVLIDEPEISLHPNWQMKYIDQLIKIFHDYSSAHFVIATHSHFLISDVSSDSSNVIALNREKDNKIACRQIDFNTYGWSPDDILYNVFDVVSSRNKFVAEDIANILDQLSKGSSSGVNVMDQGIYNKLIDLKSSLKDSDPLKEVVKSILKKIY